MFTDTSGAVVGTARFDEFGVPVEQTGVPSRFGFTGNWTDPVTGFVYLRARDYDPQTRQFFRVDPALDLTGQPYAYAGNNPLTVTDPLGLFGFEALGSWFDQVTASAYHGLKSGPGVAVTSFVVGFGDSISFGLAEAARESLAPGSSCQVVKDGFYTAGGLASSFVPIPGLGVAAAAFKVGAVAVAGAATVVIKAIPAAVTAAKGLPKALIGGTVMAAKTTTQTAGVAFSPARLGGNLVKVGVERPAGSAAHHIVAGGAARAEGARRILGRFGIDIDDASNGVFLPANRFAPNPTGAAVHSRIHTKAYYEGVEDSLRLASTPDEAIATLDDIRTLLLGGGFPR